MDLVVSRVLITDQSKTGFIMSLIDISMARAKYCLTIAYVSLSRLYSAIKDSGKDTLSGRV